MSEERIRKARSEFLISSPFLGDLSIRLVLKKDKINTPTMATDAKHLFWNDEFVASLSDSDLMGVIAHEIGHVLFGHAGHAGVDRAKSFPTDIWTLACEYMANHFVVDICGLKLPGKPPYSHKYHDGSWTTEAIARDLMQNAKKIKADMLTAQIIDDHSQWGKDKQNNGHLSGKGETGNIDKDWQVWIGQALHNAKRHGKLPAGLERLIEDILEPILPYRQILAEFVMNRSKDDYSWRRPNKRHLHRGIYAPSLYSETIHIGYAMDTSGSMGAEDLSAGLSELHGICSAFPSYRIHLFASDAAVHHYQVIGPGDEIDISGLCKGGGGTSFIPVFDYISENDIQIDCLIYFTDGCGDFGDPPDYPVLWIISGNAEVPWGRRCQL